MAFKCGVGDCDGGLLGWVRRYISRGNGQTSTEKEESIGGGYFTVITSWGEADSYYIVYAKDTKVKYFVKWTGYQFGITPLYNADGTFQIYEESKD